MNKNIIKILVVFFITVLSVFLGLQYLFLGGNSVKTRASESEIPTEFSPSSTTISGANTDFETVVKIKPASAISIRGYKIVVPFDNTKLKIKEIGYVTGEIADTLGDNNTATDLNIINGRGSINFVGQITSQVGKTVNGNEELGLVKIKFTALTTIGTTVELKTSQSSIYLIKSTGEIVEGTFTATKIDVNGGGAIATPTPTVTPGGPTPSPTPGGVVTGNVKLNMKLKFQGINGKPVDALKTMTVKVKLNKVGSNAALIETTGTFTADDKGIWSGLVGFNISDVSGKYIVYVKGPQHLQKKICDLTPSESASGIYRCSEGQIALKAGTTDIDLTKILLLSGDLDGSGIVDSVDFGLVKNNLGKKDADIIAKADINRDGIVNTQDFSMILAALAIRTDEL